LPALSSSCRKQIEKEYTKILKKVVFLYTNLYSDQIIWSVLCNMEMQCWDFPEKKEKRELRWFVEESGCQKRVPNKENKSHGVVGHPEATFWLYISENSLHGGEKLEMYYWTNLVGWWVYLSSTKGSKLFLGRLNGCHEKKQSPQSSKTQTASSPCLKGMMMRAIVCS
jgi:hypothetical protein